METPEPKPKLRGHRVPWQQDTMMAPASCDSTEHAQSDGYIPRGLNCTMLFVDRGFSIDIIFGFIIWNGRQRESMTDAEMTEREKER